MPKTGVHRSPWRDFPDVVIQTTVHKLRSRPAYDKAKGGVGEAAFEVVRELIKPEKIPFGLDTVVPVMQFDRNKPNALPLVYATALAKHSMPSSKPVSTRSTSCHTRSPMLRPGS